uniref:Uncharacterized protein n=1 Tax=Bactrocera latifrons TaxID=174628 RepID=A0A0K8US98_BACLA
MPNNNNKQCNTFAFVSLLLVLLQMATAQRPSFAGIRPPGLNQKDKYNMNNNNNNNSNVDIGNRFGQPDEPPALAFGATQKPPASYIPIVFPESNYLPMATPTARPVADGIANRFGSGDADNVQQNVNTVISAAARPVVSGAPNRLPIDAKDDSELVAILNRLPEDQRPFWFINAAAIEAQRNGSFANFAGAINSRGSFFG